MSKLIENIKQNIINFNIKQKFYNFLFSKGIIKSPNWIFGGK